MLTFVDSNTISKFIPIKISNNERRAWDYLVSVLVSRELVLHSTKNTGTKRNSP
jgi:hypothetical protein